VYGNITHKILILAAFSALLTCEKTEVPLSEDCRDLTGALTVDQFDHIRDFILHDGDRITIFNKYLENPYYAFEGFKAYLVPEVGQRNISCDPVISDFNEMVIQVPLPVYSYYRILAVRKGDLSHKAIEFDFLQGMKEQKVYLVEYSPCDLDETESLMRGFIEIMKKETGI
jgi:hypothetical protein